jgi:hypothetical protein
VSAFILNLTSRTINAGHAAHEGILTMKGMLIGMMCCMAAGADTLVFIPDGPLTTQQKFIFGLILGTIGTIAGCALVDTPSLKSLARQAIANIGLASLLAPTIASSIFAEVDVLKLAPFSAVLGIGGSVIFGKAWPSISEMIASRASREAAHILGDSDKDTK